MAVDTLTEQAIALLRKDGRASFSDLARQLGTNRMSIANRLNPLFQSGSLHVIAAVHPRLLGLHVLAHVSIRISGPTTAVARFLATLNSPVFISETTGHFQLVTELHAETMQELQRDVLKIRAHQAVLGVDVMLYERVLSSFFLGEEPSLFQHSLDTADLLMMEHLQQDGRIGFNQLATITGLSPSACRSRVGRLISSGAMQIGVVRGRATTSPELVFGFGFCLTQDLDPLLQELNTATGLEFLARTVGRFDVVATIAFHSQRQYLTFVDRLRELPEMSSLETWLHVRISLERYHHSTLRLASPGPSPAKAPLTEVPEYEPGLG